MNLFSVIKLAFLASTVLGLPNRGLQKRNVQLDDWAGAGIASPPDATGFVTVIGTFVVPTIDTNINAPGSAVSLWVGIDGYSPGEDPLVQAGVDVEYAADSRLIYKAWWQWTPDDTQDIDFIVTPGDTITVQVTGAPGSNEATYKFTNQNGDEASDIMAPLDDDNVLKGQNIEWVIERLPGKPGTPQNGQLLNFGTVTFTGCSGSTQMTAASSFPVNGDAIDMLELDESVGASTVIDTSGNGDSFTVTWHSV